MIEWADEVSKPDGRVWSIEGASSYGAKVIGSIASCSLLRWRQGFIMTATWLKSSRSQRFVGRGAALGGVWMITGLFLDGWAHSELKPDSFFTPWHAVLYSGFVCAAAFSLVPLLTGSGGVVERLGRVARSERVTIAGVAIFGLGAMADLAWHQAVGIEVSNEALLSPTHLLLLIGALLTVTGPARATDDQAKVVSVPVSVSVALAAGVALFFTAYLSPFGRVSAAEFAATQAHTHELGQLGVASFAQLREVWTIAGVVVTTVIVDASLLWVSRRGRPRTGVFAMLLTLLLVMATSLGEFRFGALIPVGLVVGLVADRMYATPLGRDLVVILSMPTIWASFFSILALSGELHWSPALWSGVTVLAGIIGWSMGAMFRTPDRQSPAELV